VTGAPLTGRKPFKRNPDRRKVSEHAAAERRSRPSADRRQLQSDGLALFHGADDAHEVADIISECDVLALPAGTTLLAPGLPNDKVYVLLSGALMAFVDSTSSQGGIPIGPGESVGELSSLDGKPVSALVKAIADSRVLTLPQDLFWNRLNAIPGVARNLLLSLADRMRQSNEFMLESQRRQMALEHLNQELDVARQLQASMLPLRRPMFSARNDIEIAGIMEPASAIGGDLFDAFFVDERHLFFCIGDVSGHGVAAALFMARTIGLLRIIAMGTRRPERLLQKANEQLCTGNDSSMFVTLMCGFLDVTTGQLVYSCAGHAAPLVCQAGAAAFLPNPKGALVGVFPGLKFRAAELQLIPGATLITYTDGVTEAQNQAGAEFSVDRLIEVVANNASLPLEQLVDTIRHSVSAFTGSTTLEDDCTILALRRSTVAV
jgi:sigma-B regulation protein RsbU (phosphoserine phosphatase)